MENPKVALAFATFFLFCFSSAAETQGFVILYSDGDCTKSDSTSIPLAPNQCLETNGTTAISIVTLPPCENGQPVLRISDAEDCRKATVSPAPSSSTVNDCLSLLTGWGIGSAGFVCVGAETAAATPTISTNASVQSMSSSSLTLDPSSAQTSPGQVRPSSSGISLGDGLTLGNLLCAILLGVPTLILAILALKHRSYVLAILCNQHPASDDSPPAYESEV